MHSTGQDRLLTQQHQSDNNPRVRCHCRGGQQLCASRVPISTSNDHGVLPKKKHCSNGDHDDHTHRQRFDIAQSSFADDFVE